MVTKKQKKTILVSILILVTIFGILVQSGKINLSNLAVGDTFTPIYCNDYSFTCCVESLESTVPVTIDSKDDYFKCPTNAIRCEVSYSGGYNGFFLGSENCEYAWHTIDLSTSWKCDDEIQTKAPLTIYPNDRIYHKPLTTNSNFQVRVYEENLIFTGRAGSTVGVDVPGASGCTFNPNAAYKDGKLVEYDLSTSSYTVGLDQCILTWVPGDRHICGNIEEQCNQNSDCGGHTYGNFECNARTLQEYGCRTFTKPSYLDDYLGGYAYEPFSVDETGDESSLSRCEVISTRQVQCCGDTDCGSNAFCDITTFTCKETAECNQNSDCGVSTQCDIANKELKKPLCISGRCSFEKVQDVDCCSDQDCPTSYMCDTDYTCKEEVINKKICPFECCDGEELYLDRLCPSDKPYCVDNKCQEIFEPSKDCGNCDEYALSTMIGSIWKDKACKPTLLQTYTTCIFSFIRLLLIPIVLIFSLLFGKDLFSNMKATKGNKPLIWILAILVAFLLAYFVYLAFWIGIIVFAVYLIIRFSVVGRGIKFASKFRK